MLPYIGITDFMNPNQVRAMLDVFNAHKPANLPHQLHVGVMTSYKHLHGLPNKWTNAFPKSEEIQGIFSVEGVYNCLHYADYDGHPELWKSLAKAISIGGDNMHALQLDMIWPDPGQVAHGVHTSRKHVEVILQIGKIAMEEAENDPKRVADRLEDYGDAVQRVLLDKSGGRGLGMDAIGLIPFVHAIQDRCPNIMIGAAGGLGPVTMDLVDPLTALFPGISLDAQGKLRPSGSALDPIDLNMTERYLIEALKKVS